MKDLRDLASSEPQGVEDEDQGVELQEVGEASEPRGVEAQGLEDP
jgi:hypothetical protein